MAVQNRVESGVVPEVVVFSSIRRLMALLRHHGIKFTHDKVKGEIRIKGQIEYVGLYSCGLHFYQDDDKRIMFCRGEKGSVDVYIFGNNETSYINLPGNVEVYYRNGHVSVQY
jgi:hypothetical protein